MVAAQEQVVGGGERGAAEAGREGGGVREDRGGGRVRGRVWTLQFKTVVGLLVLLMAAVGICGVVFLRITRDSVLATKRVQVTQMAYGLAAALGHDVREGPGPMWEQLGKITDTPGVDFAVVTDPQGRVMAARVVAQPVWEAYAEATAVGKMDYRPAVGTVRRFERGGCSGYTIAVPMFDQERPAKLVGYLHLGLCDEAALGEVRALQGWILLTCMGAVLLTLPLAAVVVRHVTVPMQRLAAGARALAAGELSHRVRLRRGDEIGELADAFDAMAETVQRQQEDIRQINAGLEAKVAARTEEIEKVNERLKAEMAEKEDFLRAVSHDLNAPLRNIAGMASMLLLKYQEKLEKDAVQRLERIQKNVEVECELLNELLELSRIKSRREKIEKVNLHALVTTIGEQLGADLEAKGITLKVDGWLPEMEGERARLRQALQNLVDNSIKYMRPTGTKEIRVGTRAGEGDEVVLYVQDTGVGIAREDMPNLFHVFRRARNATMMKVPGKGVGLASVKSIFENYHARVWVESEVGVGTTFFIGIPGQYFRAAGEAASEQAGSRYREVKA